MTEPEPDDTDERRERDRRTMEAIERLYRKRGKRDVEPQPALFDDNIPIGYQPDQMARYVEIMGRRPLHAEEDWAVLSQQPR